MKTPARGIFPSHGQSGLDSIVSEDGCVLREATRFSGTTSVGKRPTQSKMIHPILNRFAPTSDNGRLILPNRCEANFRIMVVDRPVFGTFATGAR